MRSATLGAAARASSGSRSGAGAVTSWQTPSALDGLHDRPRRGLPGGAARDERRELAGEGDVLLGQQRAALGPVGEPAVGGRPAGRRGSRGRGRPCRRSRRAGSSARPATRRRRRTPRLRRGRRRRAQRGQGTPSAVRRSRMTILSWACTRASAPGWTEVTSAIARSPAVGTCSWSKVTASHSAAKATSAARSSPAPTGAGVITCAALTSGPSARTRSRRPERDRPGAASSGPAGRRRRRRRRGSRRDGRRGPGRGGDREASGGRRSTRQPRVGHRGRRAAPAGCRRVPGCRPGRGGSPWSHRAAVPRGTPTRGTAVVHRARLRDARRHRGSSAAMKMEDHLDPGGDRTAPRERTRARSGR